MNAWAAWGLGFESHFFPLRFSCFLALEAIRSFHIETPKNYGEECRGGLALNPIRQMNASNIFMPEAAKAQYRGRRMADGTPEWLAMNLATGTRDPRVRLHLSSFCCSLICLHWYGIPMVLGSEVAGCPHVWGPDIVAFEQSTVPSSRPNQKSFCYGNQGC